MPAPSWSLKETISSVIIPWVYWHTPHPKVAFCRSKPHRQGTSTKKETLSLLLHFEYCIDAEAYCCRATFRGFNAPYPGSSGTNSWRSVYSPLSTAIGRRNCSAKECTVQALWAHLKLGRQRPTIRSGSSLGVRGACIQMLFGQPAL